MNSPVKIFYYTNGDVRVTTEFQRTVYTAEEWEWLSRFIRDYPLIDEGLKADIPGYNARKQ